MQQDNKPRQIPWGVKSQAFDELRTENWLRKIKNRKLYGKKEEIIRGVKTEEQQQGHNLSR